MKYSIAKIEPKLVEGIKGEIEVNYEVILVGYATKKEVYELIEKNTQEGIEIEPK